VDGLIIIGILAIIISYLKPTKKRKINYIRKIAKRKKDYSANTNTNYWRDENRMKENNKKITIKLIGEHFNKSSREINKIFEKLQWIEKKERWWILTPTGKKKGGQELYNPKNKTKYTIWTDEILKDSELINKINQSAEQTNEISLHDKTRGYDSLYRKNKKTMTTKEKKNKGDKYEAFIANYFKEQGYITWEHGKEKGVEDSSIDLIVKKEKKIYFIQCKNWETWKINHKEIKATRTDIREYLKKNKIFWELIKDYEHKLLYITSKECLTKGAYKYIKENNNIVEHQIIPMEI